MIPVKLSKMMKVKNFRYVLNHKSASIHLGTFFFGVAGFDGTVVLRAVALMDSRRTAGFVAGHDNDRSGLLEFGVIPSCTGESGERCDSCVLSRTTPS